jgi:hypothetical protein
MRRSNWSCIRSSLIVSRSRGSPCLPVLAWHGSLSVSLVMPDCPSTTGKIVANLMFRCNIRSLWVVGIIARIPGGTLTRGLDLGQPPRWARNPHPNADPRGWRRNPLSCPAGDLPYRLASESPCRGVCGASPRREGNLPPPAPEPLRGAYRAPAGRPSLGAGDAPSRQPLDRSNLDPEIAPYLRISEGPLEGAAALPSLPGRDGHNPIGPLEGTPCRQPSGAARVRVAR